MLKSDKSNKSALARSLGVSRSSLYYTPRQLKKDEALREAILRVIAEHPAYGHRRIALVLNTGKNRVYRIMRKYRITPTITRRKPRYTKGKPYPNIPNRIKHISPCAPNVIWVGDFTELYFHHQRLYLATIIDLYSREVLSWQLGTHHTTQLVLDVLSDAVSKRGTSPGVVHTDQGSEYTSSRMLTWLRTHHIVPSFSGTGKPWHNGSQESFYSQFKLEFGRPSRHQHIVALSEALGRYMYYYNTKRIHSRLKMPPRTFRVVHEKRERKHSKS